MPTAIERGLSRRAWLGSALGVLAATSAPRVMAAVSEAATTGATDELFIAWDDAAGKHWVGILRLALNAAAPSAIVDSLEVPTRAHGLMALPGGGLLAVARRPGDWMLRWSAHAATPDKAARTQWLWAPPERRFCGHAVMAADGSALYTTETDLDSGAGLMVRRDPTSLDATAIWPTHGIDPHDMQALPDGRMLVANGGVPTQPETGRTRLDLVRMDSSLVCIHPASGDKLAQWRLADRRLSLRHLARHANGMVGIALQAEHDDPAQRAAAPLLALLDARGDTLRAVSPLQAGTGYGGDIAATRHGWAISCPRDNLVTTFALDGQPGPNHPLASACALTEDHAGEPIALGGNRWSFIDRPAAAQPLAAGLQIDNHAVRRM